MSAQTLRKGALVGVIAAASLLHVHVSVAEAEIAFIGQHQRGNGPAREFTLRDGDALNPGDKFQILITTKATAVFYAIIYVARDGAITQIFPAQNKPGEVPPGATRFVPDENNHFALDANGGRELMFVITHERPMGDLPAILKEIQAAVAAPAEILTALKSRFAAAQKLEITNTGRTAAGPADPIAHGLVSDIERAYTLNPWPAGLREAPNAGEPADDSIPEEVRRKAEEVRELLRRPAASAGN